MAKIGWIDSHAHLVDEQLFLQVNQIMTNMANADVVGVCSISMNLDEYQKNKQLKALYPMIDIALGIHPGDVATLDIEILEAMMSAFEANDVVAIGEIGLDYYWDKTHIEKQKEFFIRQIEIANKLNKPIIVHMRDASADTLAILQAHPPIAGGIMHCYSGSVEMVSDFLACNMLISLAGPLTFKNAKTPKQVAEIVPLDKLLIETDSPYLTPEPFRGKQNNPSLVQYVGKELSLIKQINEEELKGVLQANYFRLLKK